MRRAWPAHEPWTEATATSVVAYSLQQVNSYPAAVVTARPSCALQQSISEVGLFGDGGRLSGAASSPRATGLAIESTGDDWKPVFNIMEGTCEVLLVVAGGQHQFAVRTEGDVDHPSLVP